MEKRKPNKTFSMFDNKDLFDEGFVPNVRIPNLSQLIFSLIYLYLYL